MQNADGTTAQYGLKNQFEEEMIRDKESEKQVSNAYFSSDHENPGKNQLRFGF